MGKSCLEGISRVSTVTEIDARRLVRLHLDQALSLATMLEETLLIALITEASEYCDARGFVIPPDTAVSTALH